MKKMLYDHIKQYWVIYLTLCCVFLAGGVFGAVGVGSLGTEKAKELTGFFNSLLGEQPTAIDTSFLQQLARDNFIMMAGIWVLGLTVIGAPLVYLIVFTRGFIFGFTVVFIIQLKKMMGLGLVLFTVLFPSLLAVPCLLLGAGLATVFSFLLLQGRMRGDFLKNNFLHYCGMALLISIAALATGVIQGYFTILGARLFGL